MKTLPTTIELRPKTKVGNHEAIVALNDLREHALSIRPIVEKALRLTEKEYGRKNRLFPAEMDNDLSDQIYNKTGDAMIAAFEYSIVDLVTRMCEHT